MATDRLWYETGLLCFAGVLMFLGPLVILIGIIAIGDAVVVGVRNLVWLVLPIAWLASAHIGRHALGHRIPRTLFGRGPIGVRQARRLRRPRRGPIVVPWNADLSDQLAGLASLDTDRPLLEVGPEVERAAAGADVERRLADLKTQWRRDQRSDTWKSVAAGVGVAGAAIGLLLGLHYGWITASARSILAAMSAVIIAGIMLGSRLTASTWARRVAALIRVYRALEIDGPADRSGARGRPGVEGAPAA